METIDNIDTLLASLLVGAAAAGILGYVADIISRRRIRETRVKLDDIMSVRVRPMAKDNPLEAKLEQAVAASARLVSLTSEITDALDNQVAETKRLQSEAAETRAFMNANQDVVIATRAMLRAELREELKSELEARGVSDRRFQIRLSIGSFVAGIVATVVFQVVWTAITAVQPT